MKQVKIIKKLLSLGAQQNLFSRAYTYKSYAFRIIPKPQQKKNQGKKKEIHFHKTQQYIKIHSNDPRNHYALKIQEFPFHGIKNTLGNNTVDNISIKSVRQGYILRTSARKLESPCHWLYSDPRNIGLMRQILHLRTSSQLHHFPQSDNCQM